MTKMLNFCTAADAYKWAHWMLYPENTQKIYGYLESRGGLFEETMFFGLQYILQERFVGQVVQPWMIKEGQERAGEIFGHTKYFNTEGWTHIIEKYDGHLPVTIKSVPEGLVVPTHNILISAEGNGDPKTAFLSQFIETQLMQSWYPQTVCTLSYQTKKIIAKWAEKTGTVVSPFHLHDFGFRGVSSMESAAIGGAAHLVNFRGTDTTVGIDLLKKHYRAKDCGYSVMASEHSATIIYGQEHEEEAYTRFLSVCPDDAILSIVIDSWDTIHAVGQILGINLKDKILARKGKVVFRPDSGDPVKMSVQVLQMLWVRFGGKVNAKGFRVLDPHVGVIYGDGINYRSIDQILQAVVEAGFCVSNIIFGEGGALLQQVDRDTHKFAFKPSWALINGEERELFKHPKTDPKKASKRGRLKLVDSGFGSLVTVAESFQPERPDILQTVFQDGKMVRMWTLDEVRTLAAKQ